MSFDSGSKSRAAEGCLCIAALPVGAVILWWWWDSLHLGSDFVDYVNRHLFTNPYNLPGWYETGGSILGITAILLYFWLSMAIVVLAFLRFRAVSICILTVGVIITVTSVVKPAVSAVLILAALAGPALLSLRQIIAEQKQQEQQREAMRTLSRIHELMRKSADKQAGS